MSYAPAAIHQLAKLAGLAVDENGRPIAPARNENSRIAALNSLLDRAIGRPRQVIEAKGDVMSHIHMHLLAAQAISEEIVQRQQQPVTINAEPQKQPLSLLDQPPPLE
jgi:hypothetical protein